MLRRWKAASALRASNTSSGRFSIVTSIDSLWNRSSLCCRLRNYNKGMSWSVPLLWFALLQTPDHQAEGLKALEAQQYPAAVAAFEKAIAAEPNDYGAHFHLALAQSLLGKDAEAIREYERVLTLKPGLYEAELNLGIVQLRQKQADAALGHLQAAAKQKPQEFRPVFYTAEALLASGKAAEAEPQYQAAAKLDPKSADTELGWGRALAQQGKVGEAAPHYRAAAERDPALRNALLELAAFYEKAQQPAEALKLYQEFPDLPASQDRLAALLLQQQRYDEAMPLLEAAVKASPTPANRMALATAYLKTMQPGKAQPLVEQALAAAPDDAELRLLHGRMLRDQRQFPAAAQEFARVVQRQPDSREAWGELAGVLILMEQYPQSLAALDKVKALGGETAGFYYLRALVLDKMKQPQPALESYQQFLAKSNGAQPDEEFKARQRVKVLQKEISRR